MGYAIKNATKQGRKIASVRSERLYFHKSITWATLTTGMISCRNSEYGHLFDDKGSSCFMPEKAHNYVLAMINSVVGDYFLSCIESYDVFPVWKYWGFASCKGKGK